MERLDEERAILGDRRRSSEMNEPRWKSSCTGSLETRLRKGTGATWQVKRRNKKLDETYWHNEKCLHQWIRQDCWHQCITMLEGDPPKSHGGVEWILAKWDKEAEPQYAELFGKFNTKQPINGATRSSGGRTMLQLAQTHGRNVNGSSSRAQCSTLLQKHLKNHVK